MKKILIFSPYYKSHIGGLESFVEDLNTELLKNISDLEIVVITSLIPNNQNKVEIDNRLKIIRLPFFEIINNFPVPKFWNKDFKKKYREIFSNDYDLVISHTRFFLTSLMACLFSKKKKTKWIHIEHGSDFVQTNNLFIKKIAWIYDQTLGKLVFESADEIISVSNAVSDFVSRLSKRKSKIFYRGFNFNKIDETKSSKWLNIKYKNYFKIVFIGRLISGKGTVDLINVLARLSLNKKWVCLIIGDGDCREKLEQQVKEKKLTNQVVLLGKCSHQKTLEILKGSDLLVNPSYTEGIPTTVLEAAILKKPVLATDVGGTRECFYKKIFLLKPKDIETFLNKLNKYLLDEKVEYDLNKNKEYVESEFNWKNIVDYLSKKYL